MLPTRQELKALKNLVYETWETEGSLRVGRPTIDSLLAKGWIEPHATNPGHDSTKKVKITDAGRVAYQAALDAPPKRKRPPIRTASPLFPPRNQRIGRK